MRSADVDAVVAGAGIAGLAAALELQSAGCEVVVVDPSDRPGGVARTDHISGYVVEHGPTTMRVGGEMEAFLRRHRLDGALAPAGPESGQRFLYRDGRLVEVPLSPLKLARSELLSRAAKLRLLREPFVGQGRPEGESVAEFVTRRLGSEVLSELVAPFLTGVYAGDETRLGAQAVFPALTAWERRAGSITLGGALAALTRGRRRGRPGSWSARNGLGPFAREIADQLSEPPALGSRVVGLGRDSGGWRVDVASPTGETTLRAKRLVVATPSLEAAHLLRGVSGDVAAALEGIVYAPIVSVPLGVDPTDVATPLEGFGFLVPREEPLSLLGCLYMSRLFPARAPGGRELLHCMLGGVGWPDVQHAPDDEIVARIAQDLDRAIGLRAQPQPLTIARWARAIPQPDRDHVSRIGWVRSVLRESPGLALAGSYLDGVSFADTLVSGVAAAREIV